MNFELTPGKIAAASFALCLVCHGLIGGMALATLILCGVYGAAKYAE